MLAGALLAAIGLGFGIGFSCQKAPDYQNFQLYQKDGHVYVGVAVNDKLLSKNFKQDCETAKKFLSQSREWIFMVSGPVPTLDGYTGFVFRAVADDEPPPLMQ